MKQSNILLLGGGALVLYYLYNKQANALTPQQQQQLQQQQMQQQANQGYVKAGTSLLQQLFGGGTQPGGNRSGFPNYNNSFVPGTGGYYNDAGGYVITSGDGSSYVNPSNVGYANALQTVMQAGNPYG